MCLLWLESSIQKMKIAKSWLRLSENKSSTGAIKKVGEGLVKLQ